MHAVRGLVVVFLSLFIIPSVLAADFTHVIINSEDWRDVYTGMLYAQFHGVGSNFLVSTPHAQILLNDLSRDNDIRVISSRTKFYILNYPDLIENRGFRSANELQVRSAQLELLSDLDEINNFIVVGNQYGYNAIAVAPYAVKTHSWVFFADRSNIDEIDALLSARKVDNLIIYGSVEREVRDALIKYKPQVIDNNDRFKDNIEIVEKYLDISSTNQVLLSNGEFIEKEIMSGLEPVLFTGKENVPDQIRDYLKSSHFEVGVLVGSDLVGAATNIRRSTGISVIVKFARGARTPTGAISAVEGLDLFYLPAPLMSLDLASARYNRANSLLEITYKSSSNIPVFFKGTISPHSEDQDLPNFGDTEAIFISPSDYKTISYPDFKFEGNNLTLDITTFYGQTPAALEKTLQKEIEVEFVNVLDECQIDPEKLVYSTPKSAFVVYIKNTGDVDCWTDVELKDVYLDGDRVTLGSDGETFIKKGKTGKVVIEAELTDSDLKENNFIDSFVYYGEREDSLVRLFKKRFELEIQRISYLLIAIIVIIILLILLLLLFFLRRRRRDDDY